VIYVPKCPSFSSSQEYAPVAALIQCVIGMSYCNRATQGVQLQCHSIIIQFFIKFWYHAKGMQTDTSWLTECCYALQNVQ